MGLFPLRRIVRRACILVPALHYLVIQAQERTARDGHQLRWRVCESRIYLVARTIFRRQGCTNGKRNSAMGPIRNLPRLPKVNQGLNKSPPIFLQQQP